MERYLPIGATLAVLSVAVIPAAHWLLHQTMQVDLLGTLVEFPVLSNFYLAVIMASFLTGYAYLLVSVRSVRRVIGPAKGTILLLILLVTCPFGGFLAFWMKGRSLAS